MKIRRGRNQMLRLRWGQGAQEFNNVPLVSSYRWSDSFMPNILAFSLAPIALGTDWATGTMWKFDDPAVVLLPMAPNRQSKKTQKLIIAPPQTSQHALANYLTTELKKRVPPQFEIVNNKDSQSLFLLHHFRHDRNLPIRERRKLYGELQIQNILETEVQFDKAKEKYLVTYEIYNIFSELIVKEEKFWISKKLVDSLETSFWNSPLFRTFFVFPNNFAIDIASSEVSLKQKDVPREYVGQNEAEDGFLGQSVQYLSALNIGYIGDPQLGKGQAQWSFQFVPNISFLYSKIQFDDFPFSEEVNFRRKMFGAGIGPRIGLGLPWFQTYFQYIPLYVWEEVEWENSQTSGASGRSGFVSNFEIGLYRFLTNRINIRFFTRTTSENIDVWNNAFEDLGQGKDSLEQVDYRYYGVSLGFFFPEIANWFD